MFFYHTSTKKTLLIFLVLAIFLLLGCESEPDPIKDTATYTLTIVVEGEGTVDPEEGDHEFDNNELVTLTAEADEGWIFLEWEGEVAERDNRVTTVLMDKNKTVTAKFIEDDEDEFAGGSGTEEDPYLVGSARQLNNVRYHLDKHFQQVEAIDLSYYESGEGWTPIGGPIFRFEGTFDGNGYKITNLTINTPEKSNVGLFGYINPDGYIKNVTLEDVEIMGDGNIGGLVGYNLFGTIQNCSAAGIITGNTDVGGLVGRNAGKVLDSHATVTVTVKKNVTGHARAGGLVGMNTVDGEITACYAAGNVTAEGFFAGGLMGTNGGAVSDCYATGDVTGESSRVGVSIQ